MTTNHTPGPWMVWDQDGSIGTVMTADGSIAVAQAQQVEHGSHEIRRANTRLIAAAPELLEALEIMIVGACAVGVPHAGERKVLQDAVDHARATINKATGEQQ